MASSLQFLLLFSFTFLILISHAYKSQFAGSSSIVLPVNKDFSSLQYVAQIRYGTPLVPVSLVVDLGGPFLWLDCDSGWASSSRRPIERRSIKCLTAAGGRDCGNWSCFGACTLTAENSITQTTGQGELAEDIVAVRLADRSENGPLLAVDQFLFSCAPAHLLGGLASGVKGMLGLGRTRIALPSQLAMAVGSHRGFAVCLSSSDGLILAGEGIHLSLPGANIWDSLMYTAFITNYQGNPLEDYYINVKSISINGRRLSLNESLLAIGQGGTGGGTKISTVVPYTLMESSIYDKFTRAFVEIAASMNMTRVASVAPFGVCFSSESKGIRAGEVGPAVPAIDLVLQSEMVKWRIYGRNSMVQVSEELMCLGFLDAGASPRASIVIGGYQLEDNLLHFDLGTGMLGFSSSLLVRQLTCSDFKHNIMPGVSLL